MREEVVVHGEAGGHGLVAAAGGPVAPLVGDLGDEAVPAQLGDQAADALAAATGLCARAGGLGVEAAGEVAVAEADDRVLAGEDGAEEVEVGAVRGQKRPWRWPFRTAGRHRPSSAAAALPLGWTAASASR